MSTPRSPHKVHSSPTAAFRFRSKCTTQVHGQVSGGAGYLARASVIETHLGGCVSGNARDEGSRQQSWQQRCQPHASPFRGIAYQHVLLPYKSIELAFFPSAGVLGCGEEVEAAVAIVRAVEGIVAAHAIGVIDGGKRGFHRFDCAYEVVEGGLWGC